MMFIVLLSCWWERACKSQRLAGLLQSDWWAC